MPLIVLCASVCMCVWWGGELLSARGPRLHPRSHLGRLHPAGSLSLRSAFGMLRRCRYLWRLIPAPASNTKPVIGPRRALAPRSDAVIDWSTPVSMTFLSRYGLLSGGGGATVTVTERCEWACCGCWTEWIKRSSSRVKVPTLRTVLIHSGRRYIQNTHYCFKQCLSQGAA